MTPQLRVESRPDGRLNLYGLQVWSTGVFHGHNSPPEGDTFTESDLDEMVRAQEEAGESLRPRMYSGHPLNPWLKMLARPKGEIKRLYRDGKVLKADLEGVDKDFWAQAQKDGARLSPDVKLGHKDHKNNKVYPLAVVGLGVLGAVPPANNSLPPLDGYSSTTHYAASPTAQFADNAQARAYGDGDVRSYASEFTLPPVAPPPTGLSRLAAVRERVKHRPAAPSPVQDDGDFIPTFKTPTVGF